MTYRHGKVIAPKPIAPEQLAKADTEYAHQCAVLCWAQMNESRLPVLRWLYAVPNGEERHKAVAGRLKAAGVKAGVADLHLPVARQGYHSLYIEMKKPGVTKPSDEQKEFAEFVLTEGHLWLLCSHWEQATHNIEQYLTFSEKQNHG